MLGCIILLGAMQLRAQNLLTFIDSEVAGPKGICVDVNAPETPRYSEGAPIAVIITGGFDDNGLPVDRSPRLDEFGFIEIHFSWPGLGITNAQLDVRSGGLYDYRGPDCVKALRDVLTFVLEKRPDKNGQFLSDLTGGIIPLINNVGLVGFSNGGNTTIAVAGAYGDSLSNLAWIVNYESPVGDGMAGAECGAHNTTSTNNPIVNPAYDPDTGAWDLTTLAWDDTVNAAGGHLSPPGSELRGGLYFDINTNEQVDVGTDFVLYPIKIKTPVDTTVYYSERIFQNALAKNLLPVPPLSHLPSPIQTQNFWEWRNGEKWIQDAVDKIPGLMFIVYAFDTDHVQSAPDKPHVLIQYEGFRNAGARLVRLNPDRQYVESVLGSAEPRAADNPAFQIYNHLTIRNAMEPDGITHNNIFAQAAVCELADRTQWNDVTPQLDDVLTNIDSKRDVPSNYSLHPNFPNPFNATTRIVFELRTQKEVSLIIYDIQGRKIRSLLTKNMQPGQHSILWDGKDSAGHSVSSGLYICKLKTDSYYRSIKMLLTQ